VAQVILLILPLLQDLEEVEQTAILAALEELI
jgi:hypothetical protein